MTTVKDERLQIRLDPAEKRLIEQAATAAHQSVSSFVFQAAALRAEEILAQRAVIGLSPQGAAALTEALARPRGGQRSPRDGAGSTAVVHLD